MCLGVSVGHFVGFCVILIVCDSVCVAMCFWVFGSVRGSSYVYVCDFVCFCVIPCDSISECLGESVGVFQCLCAIFVHDPMVFNEFLCFWECPWGFFFVYV